MTTYLFQSILFQLIFLLVYELFLKKETFFQDNRGYLLLTPVLSLLLPLMQFEVLETMVPVGGITLLPEVAIGGQDISSGAKEASFTLFSKPVFWGTVYGIGAFISLSLALIKLKRIGVFYRNPVIAAKREYKIIGIPGSDVACTFFRTVFLGDRLKGEERKQILSHELIHVQQNHSLDLMFFELLRILFWFNPLVYIYQSKIAAVHEFIADAEVVKKVEREITTNSF